MVFGSYPSVRALPRTGLADSVVYRGPRHKSGFALRFPRIVRLRPDKPASEIDTLATVAALADVPPPSGPP